MYQGGISGTRAVGGAEQGCLHIRRGTITTSGLVDALGDLTGWLRVWDPADPNIGIPLNGTAHVHGNLKGPGLVVSGGLAGARAIVDGAFGTTVTTPISCAGPMTGGGASVCIGYDPTGDGWQAGGDVCVNDVRYTGNTPGQHIYQIASCCKADAINDDVVDFGDIYGMLKAAQGYEEYASVYPGLAGAWLVHCDLGRPTEEEYDGLVKDLDRDLLSSRIGCPCSAECGVVSRAGEWDARELAAGLADHSEPSVRPHLRAAAARLATDHPRAERRAHWHAVFNRSPD